MRYPPTSLLPNQPRQLTPPVWATSGRAATSEVVAFRSGAALTVLDALVCDPTHGVPQNLLANRLALTAATATSTLEGRLAREADIRDAYHLTPSGAAHGPDGDLLAFWRAAAGIRLNGREWRGSLRALVGPAFENDVAGWIDGGINRAQTSGPLAGCTVAMRAVLQQDDRAERLACLMSDIVLARSLRWSATLPVAAQRLTKPVLRDLVAQERGGALVIQQRLLKSIDDTTRLAGDLAQRAQALRAVAPKLRAKGSDAAVAVFLSEDAVAPSIMLSPVIKGTATRMTDRAARRFCDRLVELGVARELTGRPTFRLYGI